MTAVLYRCFDSAGLLLYAGSTKSLPTRVGAHVSSKPWASEIANIQVEHFDTLAEAVAAEGRAIYFECPKYNKIVTRQAPNLSGRRLGRPLDCDKDKTFAATKPWIAAGMSRRTWYRRRAKDPVGSLARASSIGTRTR